MQIITPFQKSLIKIFAQSDDDQQFYFTGGTALSLFYLQHRKSEDLDFFAISDGVILPFTQRFEQKLKSLNYDVIIKRSFNSFVELFVHNSEEKVIFHIALDSAYQLDSFKTFDEYPGLKVNSFIDIATNKLLALFGRAALRDFIDVYFLVNSSKFSKEQLVENAKKKDPGFDLYWLGVAFERLKLYSQKDYDLSLLFAPLKEEALLSFFNEWRKEIASSL